MKLLVCLLTIWMFYGCARVISVDKLPEITLGETTFFPTIEAHTNAPIVGGNRIEVLLNGDETFPVMLRDIKAANSTITFAQYLFEGGSLAREFAEAFAERCRAALERAGVPPEGGVLHITASFGVATCPESNVASLDDLVGLADQALYRAKNDGRNRVVAH